LGTKILAAAVARGRAAWPSVDIDSAEFANYLVDRLPDEEDLTAALARTHAEDLYLACGCARGDASAVRAFEHTFVSRVAVYLKRQQATPQLVDLVRQELRDRLLVARDAEPPKIAGYSGQGPLGAWVRMVTVRIAIDLQRADGGRAHARIDSRMMDGQGDPEMLYLKLRYRKPFQAAFKATLGTLGLKERNVLRMYFLDAMTLEAIAGIHRVHRTTVARWIEEARTAILDGTRERLRTELKIDSEELESIIGAVQSQMNTTLRALLG
jgi:RNA polymerase sigma-70 factor (ECF subfamily)